MVSSYIGLMRSELFSRVRECDCLGDGEVTLVWSLSVLSVMANQIELQFVL